jgi:hypothetical protein
VLFNQTALDAPLARFTPQTRPRQLQKKQEIKILQYKVFLLKNQCSKRQKTAMEMENTPMLPSKSVRRRLMNDFLSSLPFSPKATAG